jgi:hypothetical protein
VSDRFWEKVKLAEEKVRRLLDEHFKQGICKAELARRYGVSDVTVCNIVSGKLWPHVEGRVQLRLSS